jgi:hypothetical protein
MEVFRLNLDLDMSEYGLGLYNHPLLRRVCGVDPSYITIGFLRILPLAGRGALVVRSLCYRVGLSFMG